MEHADHGSHACCQGAPKELKQPAPEAHHGHAHHGHGDASVSTARLATSATLHCLTGCAIGEWLGLVIGISLGLSPMATMALATIGGFASGYALGLKPLIAQGMSISQAFKAIWLGETISIAVMELAMNTADYLVGGVAVRSIFAPQFWIGYAVALPAGFIAAWPANYWMLKSHLKEACH